MFLLFEMGAGFDVFDCNGLVFFFILSLAKIYYDVK